MKIAILLGAIVAALAVPAAQGATTTLRGTVGPGFTITLTKGGTKVTKLKAGTYRIAVSDKAASHNFHLRGPGVNKMTTVGFTGSTTWTVKVKAGKYTYVCDPHASNMRGSFVVS